MGLFTLRFTHCSIECDKCLDGEIVNTGDMGTRTVEDVKKYWRSEGWRIGKVTLCPTCHHKKEVQMTEGAKDNLKDYLVNYSEQDIQEIREEKMQLVTAAEFKAVHRQMLEQASELEEKLSFAVESLHFIEQGRFDAAEFARKVLAEIEREEE